MNILSIRRAAAALLLSVAAYSSPAVAGTPQSNWTLNVPRQINNTHLSEVNNSTLALQQTNLLQATLAGFQANRLAICAITGSNVTALQDNTREGLIGRQHNRATIGSISDSSLQLQQTNEFTGSIVHQRNLLNAGSVNNSSVTIVQGNTATGPGF